MGSVVMWWLGMAMLQLVLLLLLLWKIGRVADPTQMTQSLQRMEQVMREEMEKSRELMVRNEKEARREMMETLRQFEETTVRQMETLRTKTGEIARENREELANSLKTFQETFDKNVEAFNALQREKFGDLTQRQEELVKSTEQRLERMRETMEQKIADMRQENHAKLEQMRETVDEKLHKTLEHRLGESFKQVSDRLEQVHQGLGEMQNLASGVGDLKKVLSNVKTRGILGEYQLEQLLDELLTPEQFERNVATRPGSHDRVEFAVKLPGREEGEDPVWLPIDAKFPTEDYQQLLDAYETGDADSVEQSRKRLTNRLKADARNIQEKYIESPYTTDFGVLFLPFEGLYAEVLRMNLFEPLQRDYRVMIAGPTTISAFLNSLQMGFRTLAIEKRSSEVWQLLGAVKTEFNKFGGILDKTRKKLDEAGKVIDGANVRTRAIERRLREVQELPHEEASQALGQDYADLETGEQDQEEEAHP